MLSKKNPNEFCDGCRYLVFLPDPNPFDWFRDDDKKAVCLAVNRVIEGGLERPSECENIERPLYCPLLSREQCYYYRMKKLSNKYKKD